MRSSGFTHSPFPRPLDRDPIRAAEDDIRRYLIRCGVISPPEIKRGEPRTALCLLGIYAMIGLAVCLGLFCLTRLECDPMFSDRGLKAVCRGRAVPLAKIVGPASYSGFMPMNMQ